MRRPQFKLKTLMLAMVAVAMMMCMLQHVVFRARYAPANDLDSSNSVYVGWRTGASDTLVILEAGSYGGQWWVSIFGWDLVEASWSDAVPLQPVFNRITSAVQ